ncbi:MAG: GxxExxY protein [Nitrospirae bacterium]|nr:GxxExxY protein [Nitrospirota bacterium]
MITDEKQMDTEKYIYKDLTYKIIGVIYEVHREIIYHKAIAIELSEKGISFAEEKPIDVKYKGKKIGIYKPDFIIEDKIILEIKVAPAITKTMRDQVYYYVKGTRYKLVLLVNFGTSKVGIKRLIYSGDTD